MKIRGGFVSNSSSSSFLLGSKDFSSTLEIAEKMIPDRDNYDEKNGAALILIDKLRELEVDNKQAISFASCNYNTYILYDDEEDVYAVLTCNNHFWEIARDGDNIKLDGRCDKYIEQKYNTSFIYLDADILIKPDKSYDTCSNKGHYDEKRYINNERELKCPKCYLKENPNMRYSYELLHKIRKKNSSKLKKGINLRA